MKTQHTLIVAPILLILGMLAGRQFFPVTTPAEPTNPVTSSTRGKRKIIRVARSQENDSAPIPTDLTGLLELVDSSDAFTTSTRLRAALGTLSAGALENLLLETMDSDLSNAGAYTLRASILNHLVAKDPFHALDVLLELEDQGFRNSMLANVMRGAARLDLAAARRALSSIEDPQLKQIAETALINSDSEASSEDLLALLEGAQSIPQFYNYNMWNGGYNNWRSYNNWNSLSFNYATQASGTLVKLAQQDLSAAETYARGLKTTHERSSALTQIANGLAQTDPELALDWARNQENPLVQGQTLSSVIGVIATKDPTRAIELLDEITNPSSREGLISTIANTWGSKDSQAALAWLESLPTTRTTVQAASTVAYQMANEDPLGAIKVLEGLPGQARHNYLSGIVNQWARRDFESARNWLTTQDDPQTIQQVISNMLPQWIDKNPNEAANFLIERSNDGKNNTLSSQLSAIGSTWAAKDQNAALNWANNLESDSFRSIALQGVYQSWANTNPSEAARHLNSVTNPQERLGLMSNIASNWMSQDPQAARDWLQTLPLDDRFTAAEASISSLSHANPRLAAEIVDTMVSQATGDEAKTNLINNHSANIASQWSNHSPLEAAEWASGITSEGEKADAYRAIASNWANFDPPGAATWIDTLPPGNPRDRATERLVAQIQSTDPGAAFDWANSMNDDDQRYSSVRNALNQWKQSDPEAALEALQSASVTEQQRERLLQQLQ